MMETPVVESPLPPDSKTNVIALISLIVGIVGLLSICGAIFIPIAGPICAGILAVGAIVTGIIGMGQTKKTGEKGKGLAIGGLVMGILGILSACLIGAVPGILALLGPSVGNVFSNISNSLIAP
jgi:hypothetical protein